MNTRTEVYSVHPFFFCFSLIFSEENRAKRQNLLQVRKQNRLERKDVSILTLSKNGMLTSKGC